MDYVNKYYCVEHPGITWAIPSGAPAAQKHGIDNNHTIKGVNKDGDPFTLYSPPAKVVTPAGGTSGTGGTGGTGDTTRWYAFCAKGDLHSGLTSKEGAVGYRNLHTAGREGHTVLVLQEGTPPPSIATAVELPAPGPGPDLTPTGDLDGDGILNKDDRFFGPGADKPAGTPPPPPPPPAPAAPTQAEQETQFYAALNTAIDAAKAGDPQPLRNFDNFFGYTRPEYEYSASFYQPAASGFNEQQYLEMYPDVAAAVANGGFASGAQHYQMFGAAEHRLRASAPVGFSEEQYLANNPDVVAAVANGQFVSGLEHYQLYGAGEGRAAVFQTVVTPPPPTPEVPPVAVVDNPADKAAPDGSGPPETTPAPDDVPGATPAATSEDPASPDSPGSVVNPDGASTAEDEEKEAALAVATEAKHSAKESRMKKLMSMRKPWSSGSSSSTGSDSMVAPSITPSSQIPPPPL